MAEISYCKCGHAVADHAGFQNEGSCQHETETGLGWARCQCRHFNEATEQTAIPTGKTRVLVGNSVFADACITVNAEGIFIEFESDHFEDVTVLLQAHEQDSEGR